jgi:hypothetical protein
LALCAAALAAPAEAAVVTYDNRAAFEAGIGGSDGAETFNGFAADTTIQNTTVALDNMTISGVPGANGAATNIIDAPALAFSGGYSVDGTAELLGDLAGAQTIRIDFVTEIIAWGADFVGFGNGARNTRIDFFSSSGALLGSIFGAAAGTTTKEFYAIVLDSPAAYALIGFNTSINDVFAMDNVAFKTAEQVTPIPAPGALLLFAASLAGLGAWRRRRP